SKATVAKEQRLGELVAVPLAPRLMRSLSLVYPKERFRSRLLNTVVDFSNTRLKNAAGLAPNPPAERPSSRPRPLPPPRPPRDPALLKVPRPSRAVCDPAALRENLAGARARAPRARVWAVVKADAYGHGLERAVRALDAADGFGLLDMSDAVALREAGTVKPILLLEGAFGPDDLRVVAEHGLTIVVHADEQIAMLEGAGLPARVPVYLKMNSGMNRLGFPPERYRPLFERLARSPAASGITLMAHFPDADPARGGAGQPERFERAAAPIAAPRSLANSAAILRYPETHADWVRPGIMLYGCSPFADEPAAALGLKPVMTLASELIDVRTLAPGDRVGYGG